MSRHERMHMIGNNTGNALSNSSGNQSKYTNHKLMSAHILKSLKKEPKLKKENKLKKKKYFSMDEKEKETHSSAKEDEIKATSNTRYETRHKR